MSTTAKPPAETTAVPLDKVLARGRMRGTVAMLGPAFIAAIAYVDPGNFSTNLSAGAEFGYALVWVVVLANLMAMPVQFLSAKIGIVTGKTLPEVCRDRYPAPVRWALWLQAEIVAMATDLAEFVGAALGLYLLFGIPMFPAALITAVAAFIVLALQARGFRPFERAIAAMLFFIIGGFIYQLLRIGADAGQALAGLAPSLPGSGSAYLAVGIIGATVMPHVVYLHSALTSRRVGASNDAERRKVLHFERWDVIVALGMAGVINLSMLMVAAKLFHGSGNTTIGGIENAHAGLATLAGGGAALVFAVALLASGISSSSVGTFAGQVVMAGFLNFRIPLVLRRLITMLPALAVIGLGMNATDVLNFSQVVLSFGIPFALVPLVLITRDRATMGAFSNSRRMTALMTLITAVIVGLNAYLLYDQFLG
ncbi:Nramp family divalent metal transporter [Saccharopolyspora phatthalungensis]|uniref:Divalent metal cation transporter MntH n=1 Tax=Saccharopolyspora phatthalungensis TaxID=664693 RepID=A0A840QKQ5_9PSEU|nr:Nramp family divalent metal transporter [Saccharopolyspora phatthalungensis]MBB5159193.1 manganese transport protein [Saccharopolyspora phatthalungensis]